MLSTLTCEQMELRRYALGGSDMNAISSFSSRWRPIDVWRSKVEPQETQHDAPTVDQERGIFMEAAMRDWYRHRTGSIVTECGTLRSPVHPRIVATPDGRVESPDGQVRALEIKVVRPHMAREWGDDAHSLRIPTYYWPQLEWQCHVLGCDEAHMWMFNGSEPHLLVYRRNQAFFESLVMLAERFWRNHVETRIPPPPDTSASYVQFLQQRHPEHRGDQLIDARDNAEILRLAREHYAEMEIIRQAEARRREIDSELKAIIQDAPGIDLGEHGRIAWKNCAEKQVVDYPALIEEAGISADLIARHTVTKKGARRFNSYLKGF